MEAKTEFTASLKTISKAVFDNREEDYALDNFSCFAGSLVARFNRRRRRKPNSPVVGGCRNSFTLPAIEWSSNCSLTL
jgi:hypothetical protein